MGSDKNSDSRCLVGNDLFVGTDEGIAGGVMAVATAFETATVQIPALAGIDAPDAKDRRNGCIGLRHNIVEVQYFVVHEVGLDTW